MALTLEHAEKTRVSDSAAELASTPHTPALVYVAFSSAQPLPEGGFLAYDLARQCPLPAAPKTEYAEDDYAGAGHTRQGDLAEGGINIERMGTLLLRGPERRRRLQENRNRKYGDYVGEILEEEAESDGPAAGNGFPVHWVTKITDLNRVSSSYIAYRNEASLHTRHAALFVQVPAIGQGV
ncbi:hypothetical protein K438DRAFT_1762173 [Mycena galopus ATCC 62051]|nr:hypothetical protein K438DRAFT_1762173 [Mycena galopus ATCC 62051]